MDINPTKPPLSLEHLDALSCSCCAEKHEGKDKEIQPMFFHGRCHIGAKTQATVAHDRLTVTCSECDKMIAEVWVDAPTNLSGAISCPHADHDVELFTSLYFEEDVMVMCPRCDKAVAVLKVLTDEEVHRRHHTN